MKNLEHIGIAVKDLEKSNKLYEMLLGVPPYKEEVVEREGVATSFFKVGETKIELLQAFKEDSAIAKFIEKKGEGIHHIAFEVDDIEQAIINYQEKGIRVLYPTPQKGADNKMVTFLHPKDCNGVLVELCQEIKKA